MSNKGQSLSTTSNYHSRCNSHLPSNDAPVTFQQDADHLPTDTEVYISLIKTSGPKINVSKQNGIPDFSRARI